MVDSCDPEIARVGDLPNEVLHPPLGVTNSSCFTYVSCITNMVFVDILTIMHRVTHLLVRIQEEKFVQEHAIGPRPCPPSSNKEVDNTKIGDHSFGGRICSKGLLNLVYKQDPTESALLAM